MKNYSPKKHFDVTGEVNVTDPIAVCAAVKKLLCKRYPDYDFGLLDILYRDFSALYRGEYQGFLACDTSYHDIQHVLDVSLAAARLIDGYDINHSGHQALGPDLAMLAMVIAIFHDSGYIRRSDDEQFHQGAEYTKTHVSRSAQFMAEYLPSIGLSDWVPFAEQLVHFTGYEVRPADIKVSEEKHRIIGALVGTADVIAQMADFAYLEKCRDRLYPEFEAGGINRQIKEDGTEHIIYSSPEDLLLKTPQFIKHTINERLNGSFGGFFHHVEAHFGGKNYYMEALENNCSHLEYLLAQNDPTLLSQSPLRPEH